MPSAFASYTLFWEWERRLNHLWYVHTCALMLKLTLAPGSHAFFLGTAIDLAGLYRSEPTVSKHILNYKLLLFPSQNAS